MEKRDAHCRKLKEQHGEAIGEGADDSLELMTEAYCVKCKAKREIKDARPVTLKNGRPATKGACPTCGTGLFKIGSGK